ncbi:hypothetical protein [Sinorhizobium fredii]|uniref:Uncharacterized protein n=1 Tax=Rhizobium fredii TaxID=380 RepID=A0A844ABG6_RHIFR|nr:hypothetical protein [Sinorhizobium fredii]MQX09867.1 hypothetical protein [Sinorhizobium fredii]
MTMHQPSSASSGTRHAPEFPSVILEFSKGSTSAVYYLTFNEFLGLVIHQATEGGFLSH